MHAKSMPAYRLYTHGPTYHCNNIYIIILCMYDDLNAGATGQPLLHTTSYPSQSTEHDASYFLVYTVSLNMHVVDRGTTIIINHIFSLWPSNNVASEL